MVCYEKHEIGKCVKKRKWKICYKENEGISKDEYEKIQFKILSKGSYL